MTTNQPSHPNIPKANSKKATTYVNSILSKYGVSPKNVTQKPENVSVQNKIISKIAAKSNSPPAQQPQQPVQQVQKPVLSQLAQQPAQQPQPIKQSNIKNIAVNSVDLSANTNSTSNPSPPKLKARNISEMPKELMEPIIPSQQSSQKSNMKQITIEPEMLVQKPQHHQQPLPQPQTQMQKVVQMQQQRQPQIQQQPLQSQIRQPEIQRQQPQIQHPQPQQMQKTHKINKKFDLMNESIKMLLKTPVKPSANVKSDLFSHNMTHLANLPQQQAQAQAQQQSQFKQNIANTNLSSLSNQPVSIFNNSNAVNELENKRQFLLNEQKRELEKIKYQREQLKSIQNRHKEIKLMKAIDDEKQKLLALQEQSKNISLAPISSNGNGNNHNVTHKRISSRPIFKVNKEGFQMPSTSNSTHTPNNIPFPIINNNRSKSANNNKNNNAPAKIFDYTTINNINSSIPSTPKNNSSANNSNSNNNNNINNNIKVIKIGDDNANAITTPNNIIESPIITNESPSNTNNNTNKPDNLNKLNNLDKVEILPQQTDQTQPQQSKKRPANKYIPHPPIDDDDVVLTKKDIEVINSKKALKNAAKTPQDNPEIPENRPNSASAAETISETDEKADKKTAKRPPGAASTAEPYKYHLKTEKKIVWPKDNEIYTPDKYANKVSVRPAPIIFISEKNRIKSGKISFANKKILLQNDYGFKFCQSNSQLDSQSNTLPDNIIEMIYNILIFDNIKFIHKRR